jgi:NAD(P)-dependent dehydrogenase (short-subunit alcohol dehydrogenase family)
MSRLAGKVAIITGGGSGIGAATAVRFVAEGAAVIVADADQEAGQKIVGELHKKGGRGIHIVTDVAEEDSVRQLMDLGVRQFGRLDVLVNNAGMRGPLKGIDELSAREWSEVIATNLTGVFYGVKHAARVMKQQKSGGVIINISSVLGVVGSGGSSAYTAAKHGILGVTKAAALELAPSRIRVVAVAPAFVQTKLIAGLEEAVLPRHPLGRLGRPEEVASMIAYLASDEAAFLPGATYPVDGGYTAQ